MADKQQGGTAATPAKTPAGGAAGKANPTTIEVEMVQEKVTKNSVRYQEVHDSDTQPDRIGQLYLQKHNWPAGAPQRIAVTIETIE